MASGDDNCSASRHTRGEPPHVPRMPRDKGAHGATSSGQRTTSRVRSGGARDSPMGTHRERRCNVWAELESHDDNRIEVSSKHKSSPRRAQRSEDMRNMFNAKRNRIEDLREKLNSQKVVGEVKIVMPVESLAHLVALVQRGPNPRYQTPFSWEIEGMYPQKKFVPPRFTLYGVKPDPRLGDLRLKWFDKIPAGSIENFYQLTESFVTRQRYWETYNEIEECSEEMAMASYKLGLTPRDRLWENLILDPLTNLRDFMSWVEMFVRLEDDVRQAEKTEGSESFPGATKVEKTRAEAAEAKPNPRLDRGDNEVEKDVNVEDENLSLGTIHMIGGPNNSGLENRVWSEICIIRQIVQHPHSDLLVVQLRISGYDVKRILVNTGSSVKNAIVGRDWLHRMKGIASMLHQVIKFVTPKAMKEVQMVKKEIEVLEDMGRDPEAKVIEDLVRCELDEPSSDRFFLIGLDLEEYERTELLQLLKANIEAFAWTPYEMPGIDPAFIKHELNGQLDAQPVKQRGRRLAPEHVDVVIEEVKKLKEADAIVEVIYPTWLSNTVVVGTSGLRGRIFPHGRVPEQNHLELPRGKNHNLQTTPSELEPMIGNTEVDQGLPKRNEIVAAKDPLRGSEGYDLSASGEFQSFTYSVILNALAAITFVFEGEIGRTIVVDVILAPSMEVTQKPILANTELGPSWMDFIVNYLRSNKLSDDKREAHKLKIKAARFWISLSKDLYKRFYQGPYLCVFTRASSRTYFIRSTKECASYTLEEDRGCTELYHRDIGGLICKRMLKCTCANVPSAKSIRP
ncbi:hypothetical protein Acr_28g0004290 [Actinidia rufa]|uniref:Uncharacterized protein n=1 Tax=Actinidia rufa TaxID=165716 RepID=A0A7J0HAG0_9ERIC|nr:hypothetical protein Acr_28g0004290 [Actinidia rufa]